MRFNEIDSTVQDQLDFVPREQRSDIWRTSALFITAIILVLLAGYTKVFAGVGNSIPAVVAVILAGLSLQVAYRKQKNLDLVMSTEFQNLLYAQALTLGSSFFLIAQRDGTVVHTSDGLSKVFPKFRWAEAQALEGIFEQGTVRVADRERIMGAIHSSSTEHLIFPIFDAQSEKKEYIITVEPLPRPNGFSIVRGREYLGQRAGAQLMPDILRSTSVDKLDRLLSTTPTALYTTDAYGRFEYVNPAFEALFGYGAGEILDGKLSLHHLIFSLGNQVVTEEYSLSDYSGEATTVNKRGARSLHSIVQYVLRDANGKAVGATGSLLAA